LASHPNEYTDLRRDLVPPSLQSGGMDNGDSSHSSSATTAHPDIRHDDAESAIYILVYAVIMLNTDLHHPSIKHKMQPDEFVRSTRSTVLGTTFEPSDLRRIYANVARAPLAIGTRRLTVRRTEQGAAAPAATRTHRASAPATRAALWGVGSDGVHGVNVAAQGHGELKWWPLLIGGVGAAVALLCTSLPSALVGR